MGSLYPKFQKYFIVQKMINRKHLFSLLLLFVWCSASAQESTIPYIETKIDVDGAFLEPVWEQLEEYTGFYNYLPTDIGLAANQTSVKLFHNGEHLYVRAIYKDTTPKTQVSTLKRDVSIFYSDAFVVHTHRDNGQLGGANRQDDR